ncbi:class I SAM-dependent methyltransferase [Acidisoma sp. S159]|uniref:class I SAM-dependent methyltransferase n=1 Tax=Acidisoma sp. S159 TaxID=1747225 RepID=UPI00131C370E|nr:class I SAM-dependent methyltransferase [Acidisoma sp. S159]
MIYDELVQKICHGANPFQGFPRKLYSPDMQGWNSHHRFLTDSITEFRPRTIVEVGVWKGLSTMTMAKRVKAINYDAAIVAVDTWLGSSEHSIRPAYREDLCHVFGYPSLYYTFAANVVQQKLQDVIVPLPLDSGNAAVALQALAIEIDMIHIDGAHDYEGVLADLERWWPLLKPGAVVVMDDYDPSGKIWPSVRQAVDEFTAKKEVLGFLAEPYKARFQKM